MKFTFPKTVSTFLAVFLFPFLLGASGKVSIYVSAHQDDWQLFMGVNAYDDIANSSDTSRVVIIYVTAGDYSDCINASDTEKLSYYIAREQGAKNSIELAANSHKERFTWKNDTVSINHHSLILSSYRYVACYFLRLGDGAIDGSRNISLKNFHRNRFADNYSIDSLTHYKDWSDLSFTCESILQSEIRNFDEVYLNLFDTSETINPKDHSDHYEAGSLFINTLKTLPLKRVLYEGYNSGRIDRASNLSEIDIMKESGLFAAYNQAMIDNGYPSIWNSDYLGFCDNNHFRIISGAEQKDMSRGYIAIAIFVLFLLITGLTSVYLLKKNN